MLKNSLYSVYMNFLGEIGKLLTRFGCPGILKRRFQCLKVAVNQQQYLEVAKESTTLLLEQDVQAIWYRFAP